MRTTPLFRASVAVGLSAVVLRSHTVTAQIPTVPPRPTIGSAKPYVFPKITTQTLPNGLRVAVVENHELPLVAVRLGFLGGPSFDPVGKEGTWAIMVTSLRDGTSSKTATAMSEALADLGTQIGVGVNFAQFTTAKSAWEPTLAILADMVMNPTFPPDAVSRRQAAQITAARVPPNLLAQRVMLGKLYGAEHPYARYATDSSLRRVTRDDVVAEAAAYLHPQNTVVIVSGDITPAAARLVVERAFSSWKKEGTTIQSQVLPPLVQPAPTTIYLRDVPGLAQSAVWSGQLLPSRGGKDAAAIEVIDAIVGGPGAGSRMWEAFRTSHGLSYSPVSVIQWHPEPQGSTWTTSTPVNTAKTDSAVTELLRVLRETRGVRAISAAEVDFSKKNLVNQLPMQLETVDAVATRALTIMQNRLPDRFYNEYVTRINSLTLGQVQTAATKYIDVDHLVIAVVGDRAKIEAPLRATGIPVVIVDH